MTTIAEQLQGEHAHIDGVETMTFTPDGGSAVTTAKGHYSEKTLAEISIAGALGIEATTAVVVLWHSTLGGSTPRSPDTITDSASVVWVVRAVTTDRFGSTSIKHRCVCSKQV
ncbi:MAG: hypothetical protein Q7R41_14580 [Phycisphaerales bacterium]|nr:hypothetical protein [Phycisphaerales bacterium]